MAYRRNLVATDFSDVDPRGSFLGNVFRAVTGVVGGAVGGFLAKGPIGGIVGAVGGAIGATKENLTQDAAEASVGGSQAGVPPKPMIAPPMGAQGPGVGVVPSGPGISPLGTVGKHVIAGGGTERGYHWSNHGKPRKVYGQIHPTHPVRNRRMNWGNGRALARAGRRIHSFLHHARKFYSMAHPHHKGTMAFKFKGRKKR